MTIDVEFTHQGHKVQAECSYERDHDNELVALFHSGAFQSLNGDEWYDLTTHFNTELCQDMIDRCESMAQRLIDQGALQE